MEEYNFKIKMASLLKVYDRAGMLPRKQKKKVRNKTFKLILLLDFAHQLLLNEN